MRVLFLGDIVGRSARQAVIEQMSSLRESLALDFIVVNCENAAGGFGITPAICDLLFEAGADVLTTGNHVWDKREIIDYIANEPRLLRPINMAEGTPGVGVTTITNEAGARLCVINVMTNLFMAPNDPAFLALDDSLVRNKLGRDADFILVDAHGEATSEKMALGHLADGRASMLVGTHTHIPTADHHILPGGTAYQTDAGMCGDYDSVIGMEKQAATARFIGRSNPRLSVALGTPTLCGLVVESDDSGLAISVAPFRVGGHLSPTAGTDVIGRI
ncbi:TIGR00282 family metallophosphoesterase [Candidatus Puniceispirillum marinum]|uniref:Metallophosphoesterase n=1 Tax=Puniceispirillum marinum (strain IMCC1322) TaxID=488538 RepID=D5BPN1_PUNMI|nr:TIGR00282 family metallophosphoesterase [Candidatus Puniceispirillum marinum]ADE40533.1 metallophosphoesterase [Candidatus Puniceispirillum marinum IMCC1322]